jgi:ERCC4-type nuclease
MLIAALTAYLLIHFGSHSLAVTPELDQTAELIKKDVADEARQKQALAIVDQMKAATKAYAQRREKSIDSLNGVLAKRTTPSSAIVR